jgi:5-methylcytosine-specific restriction protein B
MAVQFQPSLSYEDFVRGWRPDGRGGLALADGAFLEAVASANSDPDRPFVLVIEEINRGNPAQIFGELLTLIETDKRTEAEALRLAYPRTLDERVYVPSNFYIIGTMNLADRSLALVDLALRRRFSFLSLAPALGASWRTWCHALGAPVELVSEIENRLNKLNVEIANDRALGAQYRVGHSFVTPPEALRNSGAASWRSWYNEVVESEIAPLLAEYWYDSDEKYKAGVKSLRLDP